MRIRMISRAGMALLFLLALWVALAAAGHAASENAVWPQSDGTAVSTDGKLVIDYSHIEQGYVMARIDSPSNHRMRIRVTVGGAQLIYELNSEAEYEAFPLQMGSGKYEFSLFENVKSNKYSAEGKLTFDAQLVDENAAFLVPNPYVYYTQLSEAVAKSDELTAIFESPDKDLPQAEVYETITKFMADEFSYDFVRAASISPGELPEVDGCFEKFSFSRRAFMAFFASSACFCSTAALMASLQAFTWAPNAGFSSLLRSRIRDIRPCTLPFFPRYWILTCCRDSRSDAASMAFSASSRTFST